MFKFPPQRVDESIHQGNTGVFLHVGSAQAIRCRFADRAGSTWLDECFGLAYKTARPS